VTHAPDEFGGTIIIDLSWSSVTREVKVGKQTRTEFLRWKLKDIVLHELVQAALFNDRQGGMWESDDKQRTGKTAKQVVQVHEAMAYLANLQFLHVLWREFADHRSEIARRHRIKVKALIVFYLRNYYKDRESTFESLRKFKGQQATDFGNHLRQLLLAARDGILREKMFSYLIFNERITPKQNQELRREMREFNELFPDNRVTFMHLERMATELQDETARWRAVNQSDDEQPEESEQVNPTAEEVDRMNALRSQHRALLKKFNDARAMGEQLTKLGSAGKVDQGTVKQFVDRAKQSFQELKEFEDRHEEDLKKMRRSLRSRQTQPRWLTMARFIGPSGRGMMSTVGRQALAGVENFAQQGNLEGLNQYARQLRAAAADDSLESQEILAAAGYAQVIDTRVGQLTDAMKKRRGSMIRVINSPADLAEAAAAANDLPPIEFPASIQMEAALWKPYADQWDAEIYERFQKTIIEAVARERMTAEAGTDVAKGGAVVNSAGGPTPEATVSATFSFTGDDGQTRTETQVIQTNDEGAFEFKNARANRLIELRIGSSDLEEAHVIRPIDDELLAQLGVGADAWKALDPHQRTIAAQSLDLLFDLVDAANTLTAKRATAKPFAAYADVGFRDEQKLRKLLGSALLRGNLPDQVLNTAAKPANRDAFLNKLVSTVIRKIADVQDAQFRLPPVAGEVLHEYPVNSKTTRVVIEVEGHVSERQIDELIEQLRVTTAGVFQDSGGQPSETDDFFLTDRRHLSLPAELGGQSSVLVFELQPHRGLNQVFTADRDLLQKRLDSFQKQNPRIRLAETSKPRDERAGVPNDPYFASQGSWQQGYDDQWALKRVGFTGADDDPSRTDALKTGSKCIVAVVGSGVDWTHSELLGQMWINIEEDAYNGKDDDGNGYVDDQFGWNFRNGNNDVMDIGGHDTHVAGVIAARANNKRGIAGANPLARIMALKAANYLGNANSIDISRAIFYAVDNGARVINISYGGESPSMIEQRAIDYAEAHGVLVVVPSGNESSDAAKLALASTTALTVAGTGVDDRRAGFSNWGQPVDLSAPCMDVLSLRARNTDFLLYSGENENYQAGVGFVGPSMELYRASGTSFAAPLDSGAASLILSLRPELTGSQVKNMLLMGARDLETPGWDQLSGHGLLDVRQSLAAEPDGFALARISKVVPARRNGKVFADVFGQAQARRLESRRLQIGFGGAPKQDAWIDVAHSLEQVEPGKLLGSIPISRFNRRGLWTIRLLVRDGGKLVREARASLDLK